MMPHLRFAPAAYLAAFVAIFLVTGAQRLHADDYPPTITVDGNAWSGGGGTYSGELNWYGYSNASIFISGGTATLSGSYWVDAYWFRDPGYYDDNGNYVDGNPEYVPGAYYPFSVSGTYSQGSFSISGINVFSINTDGTPWTWTPPDNGNNNGGGGPTQPPFDTNPVANGPVGLWVNGTRYYHAANGTSEDDYYPADYSDIVRINGSGVSLVHANVAVYGSYVANDGGGVFVLNNPAVDLRPLAADGTQLITATTATYGPPQVAVNGQKWTFRGTVGTVDYYLGNVTGQSLQITTTLDATLSDSTTGLSNEIGYDNAGIFQDLGEPVVPLNANGSVLTSLANQGPASVIVNGVTWYHSTAGGTAYDAYYGTYSGQVLDLSGGTFWVSDPYNNVNTTGTYANGVFQILGPGVTLQAGDSGGSPASTSPQNRTQNVADGSTINGSLDVYGNLFTLGTWQGSSPTAGLSLSFTDEAPGTTNAASTISLVANRPSNQWIWSHANSDMSSTMPMMKLDQVNRLLLFSTADGSPQIVLDPQGGTTFNGGVSLQGRVRLQPQGDVTMGAFHNEPAQ